MAEALNALQNHPGDLEYPVRSRRRYTQQLDARRKADPIEMRRRAIPVTLIAAPFGIAAFIAATALDVDEFGLQLFAFLIGMCFGLLIASIVMAVRDASAPRRAQLAYLAAAGTTPLTPRQQQILALDAASDVAVRGWNSSLAFTPTYAELPQDIRAKARDGEERWPWFALPMTPLKQLRGALDEQFKIVSKADAEMLVADTLTLGLNSQRFAEVMHSDGAEHMMSRVAALTGVPVFDIQDLARGTDERPARLLLAADIERGVGGIRYAYVSGYLTADETWALLEPLADKAFATYGSWDEYWREVMIATAFRTDSLDAVQRQRDALAELRTARWPAASAEWPVTARTAADPA
ncbi:DUF1266 domain-containing protein [Microbacterium sp. EYE_5]|uniref:DUF1266 domain-containing protein n=1 Tax=unclassified Microbacterium TaxID=2609290 RepID=UPI00200684FA|nr:MULTISPECIES: DUF1266 domain-containing protein [unclassified Microbacterium]MCK6081277.1 DUF1266 domain-containing protein [Microbacterium sp. EYE_382]MCK6086547.1 DUF1266 domain-containing protein [Microbacterium sp. EYE_384]MCK6123955.1 DUF1266 domain-containing protein [Microbacterium sp. EYE_80]MCK6126864.1 DUF1266 domain-containing protein [Microbacterium sp. EYE_79]MCK6142232.1 DUF1266 domain-containing protein [Microbacterium sp. EYE_39]